MQHFFNQTKLYPPLADLVQHYRNLNQYVQNRKNLYNNFKQEISSFDLEKFKVNYKNMVTDDEVIMVIDEIVNYSIPKFKITIDEGKEIYEFIDAEVCL